MQDAKGSSADSAVGLYPKKSGRVLLKDIAAMAGVSPATASRALRSHPSVRKDLREKVREVASAVGYRANPWARAFLQRSSRMVGLYGRVSLATWGFTHAMNGVKEEVSSRDYNLCVIGDRGVAPYEKAKVPDLIHAGYVDGLIVFYQIPPEILIDINHQKMPCARVLGDAEVQPGVKQVTEDPVLNVQMAVDHLMGLGHRRIAGVYIGCVSKQEERKVRNPSYGWTRGYFQAMAKAQLPAVVIEDPLAESDAWIGEAFRQFPDITAVIAQDIDSAKLLRPALAARGLRCPEDISIICTNENGLLPLRDSMYTAVKVDYEQIGRAAAGAILDRLEGESGDDWFEELLIPATEVVDRGTTGPAVTRKGVS